MTPAKASPLAVTSGNTPPARREKLRFFFLTPYFPFGKCGKLRNFSFSQEFSHFPWENRNPGKEDRPDTQGAEEAGQEQLDLRARGVCIRRKKGSETGEWVGCTPRCSGTCAWGCARICFSFHTQQTNFAVCQRLTSAVEPG